MKMHMDDKYKVTFNGHDYLFDLMKISEDKAIAVFDALSDIQMANDASIDLMNVLKKRGVDVDAFDTIVTAESKSITMGAFLAKHFKKDLVILRKKKRDFFKEVIEAEVKTYTTSTPSKLYLDVTHSIHRLQNKRVLIFDDVISTGSSLHAILEIMDKVKANVIGKAFIFNEGIERTDKDVYYVYDLPIIEIE